MPWFRSALPPRGSAAMLPASLTLVLAALAVSQMFFADDVALPPDGPVARIAVGSGVTDLPVVLALDGGGRSIFAPVAGGGDASQAATDPLGGVTIAGMVGVGGYRYAVVQSPAGAVRRVPLGGDIAGWRLDSLNAVAAGLARSGEHMTVKFGTRASAAPAPQPRTEEDQ